MKNRVSSRSGFIRPELLSPTYSQAGVAVKPGRSQNITLIA